MQLKEREKFPPRPLQLLQLRSCLAVLLLEAALLDADLQRKYMSRSPEPLLLRLAEEHLLTTADTHHCPSAKRDPEMWPYLNVSKKA